MCHTRGKGRQEKLSLHKHTYLLSLNETAKVMGYEIHFQCTSSPCDDFTTKLVPASSSSLFLFVLIAYQSSGVI